VDDAHAGEAAPVAVGEKLAEVCRGLAPGQPVQVELGLHGVLAAAQPPQDAPLNARPGVEQFLGQVRLGIVEVARFEGGARGGLVGLALCRPRCRARALGGRAPVRVHAVHVAHRRAEQRAVIVVDGVVVDHGGSIEGGRRCAHPLCRAKLGGGGGVRGALPSTAVLAYHRATFAPGDPAAREAFRRVMHILLSNDDGFRSPGLAALHQALSGLGPCTVVAPDRDRSGASNSLTLARPVRAHREDNGFIAVEGTPTDCVHLAINGFLDDPPDMVVSGINAGANMGDDVHYSGTVAAAMEGRFLGLPAIAVSLSGEAPLRHYATAARVVRELIESRSPDERFVQMLNVNVPDRPYAEIPAWRATRLGNRHRSEPVIEARDPRGRTCYWIGAPGAEQDAGEGTDFHALGAGCVSVTPLAADLTRYDALDGMASWIRRCRGD